MIGEYYSSEKKAKAEGRLHEVVPEVRLQENWVRLSTSGMSLAEVDITRLSLSHLPELHHL